ncbi:MAG: glycosyltransferase, partial [Nitratireductor sp.]|nr:glycosyltransferase [Nitratireductor sp.]
MSLPQPAICCDLPQTIVGRVSRVIALSVCICTFRRANRLDRLLRALATQLGEDREILVVNDGSHDEAYEKV